MSITANLIGTLDYPEFFAFSGTSPVDVYTVSSSNKGLTLASFSFANDTGGAIQCKLYHYDGTTEYLVWTGNIAANSTGPDVAPMVRLSPDDVIRAVGASSVTLGLRLMMQLETSR